MYIIGIRTITNAMGAMIAASFSGIGRPPSDAGLAAAALEVAAAADGVAVVAGAEIDAIVNWAGAEPESVVKCRPAGAEILGVDDGKI